MYPRRYSCLYNALDQLSELGYYASEDDANTPTSVFGQLSMNLPNVNIFASDTLDFVKYRLEFEYGPGDYVALGMLVGEIGYICSVRLQV